MTDILIYKNTKERKACVFFLTLCLSCYYAPLFGEYIEALKGGLTDTGKIPAQTQRIQEQEEWLVIESAYFTIYHRPTANLKTMERRLKKRGFYTTWGRTPNTITATEEKIAYRCDALFKRVKEILDIYPIKMNVKIRIFGNRKELNEEYIKIFKQSKDMKSFYVHRQKTIYTSEEDISDSVVAHEMGHAVVDHYFSVIPPEKIGELLASYVDMHLDD